MKLFVSYARVDKHYCEQILDVLDMHEVWYDQRLHVGQKWWSEITRRLDWCDGLVFLMSPESITSKYCQQELEIARRLDKAIFPVIIQPRTPVPDSLRDYQVADFSQGLDVRAVKDLLAAIYNAEKIPKPTYAGRAASRALSEKSGEFEVYYPNDECNFGGELHEIAEAMERESYDEAVFRIKQLLSQQVHSDYIDLEALLSQAEEALEDQAYQRAAEREYRAIIALLDHKATRKLGIQAFDRFRRHFEGYDPDNIEGRIRQYGVVFNNALEMDWCLVTEGQVQSSLNGKTYQRYLPAYLLSKYPVTNEQFQVFIDSPDGYANPVWWQFSEDMALWHKNNPNPLPTLFNDPNYPRSNVCWYEALAYTLWYSHATHKVVRLPTVHEWQRAAQGDQSMMYPWGDEFSTRHANTKENHLRMLTRVDTYPQALSPFGVADMSGNVWEWCETEIMHEDEALKVAKGGSFISPYQRAANGYCAYFKPEYRYASIGFRLLQEITNGSSSD